MCKRCQSSQDLTRRCAFDANGIFTRDNFQCATANALAEAVTTRSDANGKSYGTVHTADMLIVMSWNNRGNVERMMRVDATPAGYVLTVNEAEAAVDSLEQEALVCSKD